MIERILDKKLAEEARSFPYKTRSGGATVTVFVPYDCRNNCPFCVNKEEYADCTGFSLAAILKSIERMDRLTPYCDFVFTGGEPLANLTSLQTMLDNVSDTHKIFINTTLPVSREQSEEEILSFLNRNKDKITCLNISRHMQHFVQESNDGLLAKLPVRFRINCVLYKNYPKEKLIPFMERFRKVHAPSIQFRFDYTETTPENLYDEAHDKILQDLKEVAEYTGLDGCRMRCGFHFAYKDLELVYHKTLPYSTIFEKDDQGTMYAILYDILIKQTGRIDSDWDGTVMDVDKYAHVTYEPYDLKWLERVPRRAEAAEEEMSFAGEACSAS
jgi:organic radical activating enzyme